MLGKKGVSYKEYDATDKTVAAAMQKRAGGSTSVPQIFIDDQHIGGYDDMAALEKAGKLDAMLFGDAADETAAQAAG